MAPAAKRSGASIASPRWSCRPACWGICWGHLRRGHVLVRLALCAVTAVLLWAITRGLGAAAAVSLGRCSAARYRGPHAIRARGSRGDREGPRTGAASLAVATYDQDPDPTRAASRQAGKRSDQIVAREVVGTVEATVGYSSACRSPRARRIRPTRSAKQQYQKFHERLCRRGRSGQVQNGRSTRRSLHSSKRA